MSVDRDRFVAAARSYVGARYLHQGRSREQGVDCVGLLMCVVYDVGLANVNITGYPEEPDPKLFRSTLLQYAREIQFPEVRPADLLTFRFVAEQHIAIVTEVEPLAFVHSYRAAGVCCETRMDDTWMRRLRGCFRLWAFNDR